MRELPCSTCSAECCGPVTLTIDRLRAIRALLAKLPRREYVRLAIQKRGVLDCRFVDKAHHTCSIYEERPQICRIFGRTEGLVCPRVGQLVQILPKMEVDRRLQEDRSEPVMLSNRFRW